MYGTLRGCVVECGGYHDVFSGFRVEFTGRIVSSRIGHGVCQLGNAECGGVVGTDGKAGAVGVIGYERVQETVGVRTVGFLWGVPFLRSVECASVRTVHTFVAVIENRFAIHYIGAYQASLGEPLGKASLPVEGGSRQLVGNTVAQYAENRVFGDAVHQRGALQRSVHFNGGGGKRNVVDAIYGLSVVCRIVIRRAGRLQKKERQGIYKVFIRMQIHIYRVFEFVFRLLKVGILNIYIEVRTVDRGLFPFFHRGLFEKDMTAYGIRLISRRKHGILYYICGNLAF